MGFFSKLGGMLNPFDGKVLEAPPGLDKLPGMGTLQKGLDATVNKLPGLLTDSINGTVGKLPGVPDLPGGSKQENGPAQQALSALQSPDFANLPRPEQIKIEKQARAAAGTQQQGQGTNDSIIGMLQNFNSQQQGAAPAAASIVPGGAGGAVGGAGPSLGQAIGAPATAAPAASPAQPTKNNFKDDLFSV